MQICLIHKELFSGEVCSSCREARRHLDISIGPPIESRNLPPELIEELRRISPELFANDRGSLRLTGDIPQSVRDRLSRRQALEPSPGYEPAPARSGDPLEELLPKSPETEFTPATGPTSRPAPRATIPTHALPRMLTGELLALGNIPLGEAEPVSKDTAEDSTVNEHGK